MIFSGGDLGKLLSSWRKVKKLTQGQVAEILGLNQPVISAAETGSIFEAQNRMARIYYFQLESFEAGEMRELDDCVKLAKNLAESRKWLRLTKEIVAERICMGVGSVAAAESPYYMQGALLYTAHALASIGLMEPEERERVINGALIPWFWSLPVDTSVPKGARRPETPFPAAGSKAAAEKWRMMRDADFDGREEE